MTDADALALAEHLRALDAEWTVPRGWVLLGGTAPDAPSGPALVPATAELWRWAVETLAELDRVAPHASAAVAASEGDYDRAHRAHPLGLTQRARWTDGRIEPLSEEVAVDLYRRAAEWILAARQHLAGELAACAGARRPRHPWVAWDAYVGPRLRFVLVPCADRAREAERRRLLETLTKPGRMLVAHREAAAAIRAVTGWLAGGAELDAILAVKSAVAVWVAEDRSVEEIRSQMLKSMPADRSTGDRTSHVARRLVAGELGVSEKTIARIASRAGGNLAAFGRGG